LIANANQEPRCARTIEPGIGTDLPRRTVVGATAELYTEGGALRVEIVAGSGDLIDQIDDA
jgi:hypothetical protein